MRSSNFIRIIPPIHWLMNITEYSARLTRWYLRPHGVYFDIKYKRGKENKFNDSMYLFHSHDDAITGEDDTGEDDDNTFFGLINITRISVTDFDNDDPDFNFPEELRDFTEQE